MEQFSAAALYHIGTYLGKTRGRFEGRDREAMLEGLLPNQSFRELFNVIRRLCETVGLKLSVRAVDECVETFGKACSVGQFSDACADLEKTIRRELTSKFFFYLPEPRAEFYGRHDLFGGDVSQKFSQIQYDIIEAGNCFAMARPTACVFHLMRIMEVGVQALGSRLGVTLVADKNWQNILDEVNKAIKILPPKNPWTIKASQTSAHLYAVKLAWRNEVMHPHGVYTLEEAETLIRHVKVFMEHLATII